MSITKNVLLNWYSSMKKKWERFGWFLTLKIDFESQIFGTFWQLAINPKFNNFLWVCWFFCKNLSNFVPPTWKLHNPYCCTIPSKKPKFGFFGGKSTVCKSTYVFFLRLALVNLISSWLVWADIKFIFACWPKQSTYKPGQR